MKYEENCVYLAVLINSGFNVMTKIASKSINEIEGFGLCRNDKYDTMVGQPFRVNE